MKTVLLLLAGALLCGCTADGRVDYEAVEHVTRSGFDTYDRAKRPEYYRPAYFPPVVYPDGRPVPYPAP